MPSDQEADANNNIFFKKMSLPSHAEITAYLHAVHGFTPAHFACEQRDLAQLRTVLRSSDGVDLSGPAPTTDRGAEVAALRREVQARGTCRVQVRTPDGGAGWVFPTSANTKATSWGVVLDGRPDVVAFPVARLERVAVPALAEVAANKVFGRVELRCPPHKAVR